MIHLFTVEEIPMIHGCMVAIVTPMHPNGDVDFKRLMDLIEWQIDSGSDGIIVLGTTGESATITHTERREIIKKSVEHVKGRIPVIAGTGANSTRTAIELTAAAKEDGADVCLLVTPYYNKPTQEGLYLHYKAVAEAVDIPQILYNVPSRTGVDLLPETVVRLADVPNIVSVKEATGDISRVEKILSKVGDNISMVSGDDGTAMEFMFAGGHGVISVTANIAPRQMKALCKACEDGDVEKARQINDQLMPLHKGLFVESNPIPAKWALEQMGKIDSGIRLPLTPLSVKAQLTVKNALTQSGILK